jgi:ribosomal protein S18 acetylase RimI-like enzyme
VDQAFTIEENLDPRDVAALNERLYEFNAAALNCDDGRDFAVFVRAEDGALRAGLYGWTWGGRLEIQYLWVHESLRRQGVGSRLIAEAERIGRERGCQQMTVETNSYQAPDFYPRHGFAVYAILDGYPDGHQRVFLRKYLHDDSEA